MMLIDNDLMTLLSITGAALLVLLLASLVLMKVRENRKYRPFPRNNVTHLQQADIEDEEDDDDDVITEIINTMDYHQVPKEVVAEKARWLAEGAA